MKFLKNIAIAALVTTAFAANVNAAVDFSAVDLGDFDAVMGAARIVYADSATDVTLRVNDDLVDSIAALKAVKPTDGDAANLVKFELAILEDLVKIAGDAGKLKAYLGTVGGHVDIKVDAGFDASNNDPKTYRAYYKAPLTALSKAINPKSVEQALAEKLTALYGKREFLDGSTKHKLSDVVAMYSAGKVAEADALVKKITFRGKKLDQLDHELGAARHIGDHAAYATHEEQVEAALKQAHEDGKAAAKLTVDQEAMVKIFTDATSTKTIVRKLPELKGVDLGTAPGVAKFMEVVNAKLGLVATLTAQLKTAKEDLVAAQSGSGSAPQGSKKKAGKTGAPNLGLGGSAVHSAPDDDGSGSDDDDAAHPGLKPGEALFD